MRLVRFWGVLALAVGAAVLTGAAPTSAEFQLDLYVGGALTNNVDFSFSGVGSSGSTKGMEVDNALVFGGRMGYWFDALPWFGVAVDAFKFTPDIPSQTVNGSIAGVGPVSGQAQRLHATSSRPRSPTGTRRSASRRAWASRSRLFPTSRSSPSIASRTSAPPGDSRTHPPRRAHRSTSRRTSTPASSWAASPSASPSAG